MEDMRFVAYYRVSTQQQGQSGLGLEAQVAAVKSYLARDKRHRLLDTFKEIESGKRNDRPKLEAALAACRLHKATLIIAKLDRLARNVYFISQLQESKVNFLCCDMPQATKLNIQIMAAFAEHEAEAISARTKAALAAAKARGVKLGGNPENLRKSRNGVRISIAVRQAKARQRREDLADEVELVTLRHKGKPTLQAIADHLNKKKIPAPRGGQWSPVQVARIRS
jgi:DNA invertase Pin-like site-specific DNA recombinase